MTQKERDRLVALKKARKRLIAQKQAAVETGVSERPVRRLLRRLKRRGDRAVIHAARGERPNRQLDEELRAKAVEILSRDVYRGLGPTLACEYLAQEHGIQVSRDTARLDDCCQAVASEAGACQVAVRFRDRSLAIAECAPRPGFLRPSRFHSHPRACRRRLRSQLHRLGLASFYRARPRQKSISP